MQTDIGIEIKVYNNEEQSYDLIPVLIKIIDDMISRGGFTSCKSKNGGGFCSDSIFVFTESTCPLVLSQSSILKYLQQAQKSKSIRRIRFLRLTIFLTNIHEFFHSVWKWFFPCFRG